MKLIADSGSSKTDWACLTADGRITRFSSAGYNPNYITREYMATDIRQSLPQDFEILSVREIYFYGAGVTKIQYGFVREVLQAVFPQADNIIVAMDLLGAAQALLGDQSGFALILGTGTNSCLYNGKEVTLNIDSLGFILGDEGSGAYIGKRLIVDYIRGNIPREAIPAVQACLQRTGDALIDEIYTKPFPNRFCAQYCRFVKESFSLSPYFEKIVQEAFAALFENIITHYPRYQGYKLHCAGSVAYHFHDILAATAANYGMPMGRILQYPIDGLITYHNR